MRGVESVARGRPVAVLFLKEEPESEFVRVADKVAVGPKGSMLLFNIERMDCALVRDSNKCPWLECVRIDAKVCHPHLAGVMVAGYDGVTVTAVHPECLQVLLRGADR